MEKNPDLYAIDFDELKRRITEAIRAVIQERANELGISYEDCIDLYFPDRS
jgi:hypothetical protein